MKYKIKNTAFSQFETIIYITLVSIFTLITIPILKTCKSTNRYLCSQSMFEKDNILEIIEKYIQKGSCFSTLKNSVTIYDCKKQLLLYIPEDFYNTNFSKGNTLVISIPKSDGKHLTHSILIFQFLHKTLFIYEATYIHNKIFIKNCYDLLENTEGEFIKDNLGILITLILINEKTSKRRVLKGYETFPKEYKK